MNSYLEKLCKHFLFNLEGFNIIDEKVVYSIIFGVESKNTSIQETMSITNPLIKAIVDDLHINQFKGRNLQLVILNT